MHNYATAYTNTSTTGCGTPVLGESICHRARITWTTCHAKGTGYKSYARTWKHSRSGYEPGRNAHVSACIHMYV